MCVPPSRFLGTDSWACCLDGLKGLLLREFSGPHAFHTQLCGLYVNVWACCLNGCEGCQACYLNGCQVLRCAASHACCLDDGKGPLLGVPWVALCKSSCVACGSEAGPDAYTASQDWLSTLLAQ
jgi:hypothetical protein